MNQSKFIEEINNLGIEPTCEQLNQLEKYYELLIEYNKKMNLTSIVEKEDAYLKHFYDSLTIVKIVNLNTKENMCDLGSGAGFPGIVLKIFYPKMKVTLVDSLNKRIEFLNIVIKELNLKGIETVSSRIEDYAKDHKEEYDLITARAVASINILLELGINLLKNKSYFVFMKGNIETEPDYKNAMRVLNCSQNDIIKFKLPIENSNRCLVKIIKNASTNPAYPRRFSEIKKKPL